MSQSINEVISFAPGQVLRLDTGNKYAGRPSYVEVSYDDVLKLLAGSSTKRTARRSKSEDTKRSRHVGLLCRAIKTGKWATGATINSAVAYERLILLIKATPNPDALTSSAREEIAYLIKSDLGNPVLRRNLFEAMSR